MLVLYSISWALRPTGRRLLCGSIISPLLALICRWCLSRCCFSNAKTLRWSYTKSFLPIHISNTWKFMDYYHLYGVLLVIHNASALNTMNSVRDIKEKRKKERGMLKCSTSDREGWCSKHHPHNLLTTVVWPQILQYSRKKIHKGDGMDIFTSSLTLLDAKPHPHLTSSTSAKKC